MRCPRCSSPVGPEQDWCLECGAPARTRLAPTPNWQLPTVAIATILALAGALLAFAFVKLTSDDDAPAGTTPTAVVETAPPVITTPPVVTPPPAVTTTAPGQPTVPSTVVPGQTVPAITTPGPTTTAPATTTPTTTPTTPTPEARTTPGTTTAP
jgi:hypothetical protein